MAEWVILELSSVSEAEDPALISASIRHIIRGAEVFIPASVTQVGDDRVITYLVDGYAFVKKTQFDQAYFRLEGTRYVQSVVRQTGANRRLCACITDRDIEKFRQQIRRHTDQGIDVGDLVVVNSGPYKNLQAVVIEDIPEQDAVQVRVELRSKDSLITLPRSFLFLVSKADCPAYVVKTKAHREWWDIVRPVLSWSPAPFQVLRSRYQSYQLLGNWLYRGQALQSFLRYQGSGADRFTQIRSLWSTHSRLSGWLKQQTNTESLLQAWGTPLKLTPVLKAQKTYDQLLGWSSSLESQAAELNNLARKLPWVALAELSQTHTALDSFWLRFQDLARSVNSLERQMGDKVVVDNLVVDGLNMLSRCALAPGLSDLSDSKGRPTGAIVGFLNSLASLRKRYPEADIWVCWDNPSMRRRSLYADYKANRNPQKPTFEVLWLRRVLPSLGVWQASAEGEEADDVIASLVRGRLQDQRNLVISNDRDFLQLVTDQTHVLVPAVGSGKEKLCTPEQVQTDYGVPPEKMLHLRALGGDTSDNIPGAPGCGIKTACKLLHLYGTVDGIFGSNLAGLSQSLRDKLRGAEDQVRLNLQLMGLVTDLDLQLNCPIKDQTVVAQSLDDIEMNSTRLFSAFFSG